MSNKDSNLPADSGAQLRSLYQSQGGVRAAFSNKAADYAAARPSYPAALFDQLVEILHQNLLTSAATNTTIADVGAGTGLLTQGLLQRGFQVIAVEPNREMREAADALLGSQPRYRSLDGSAESLPLPANCVELITAAQAFHWFDVDRARAEFLRVLTPSGQVALIWNDRLPEDPINDALDGLSTEFGGAKRAALMKQEKQRAGVAQFFGATTPQQFSWPHSQKLDENGFLALVFSRSYMPPRDSADGIRAAARVRELFSQRATSGLVEIPYRTMAIIGRPG